MNLKVLVDNNALIDRYFLAEPGLSFYINDEGHEVLFDLGYSDIFIQNAEKMGVNLLQISDIVISHGHLDHTWGLEPLARRLNEARFEKVPVAVPVSSHTPRPLPALLQTIAMSLVPLCQRTNYQNISISS